MSRSMRGEALESAMAAPNECPSTATGPVDSSSNTEPSQEPYQDNLRLEAPRSPELRPG